MTRFERALEYLLANEGGFSNVKEDRGGATKYGITREEASRWFKRPVSVEEMKTLSKDTAKEIYESWYWRPLYCDGVISDNIAICLFDLGVVRGISIPGRYAQTIANKNGFTLAVDGHIGYRTLAALNSLEEKMFIEEFSRLAENGFNNIVKFRPSQKVFLKGWLNRARRYLTLLK